jgi:hypothetical protein
MYHGEMRAPGALRALRRTDEAGLEAVETQVIQGPTEKPHGFYISIIGSNVRFHSSQENRQTTIASNIGAGYLAEFFLLSGEQTQQKWGQ